MATSTIFTSIEIKDPQEVEIFLNALEETEALARASEKDEKKAKHDEGTIVMPGKETFQGTT